MQLTPFLLAAWFCGLPANAQASECFRIRVVDDATGRGVPLVELTTVNNVRFVTDSAGLVAFDEPGLLNRRVFLRVSSHGYESPDGGFGAHGRAFDVTVGGEAVLKLKRINIAERLYRVTGGGIYRDSVLLGDKPPLAQPLLNAGVLGSDSVVNAVFNGRIHWFWGDTNLPPHPLGIFDVPGATSPLPENDGLQPDVGVDLNYFVNEAGNAKPTADMPGPGPTWIGGLTVLQGEDNRERMFASYVKIKPPMETYERGLVEFNANAERFELVKKLPLDASLFPDGHPFKVTEHGVDYVCFPQPFPTLRVRAMPDDFQDLTQYESYTCLTSDSTEANPVIERDESGVARYSWKRGVPAVRGKLQERLLKSGDLKPDDVHFQLVDVDSGKPLNAHGGSVYWNEHRQRWVMIMLEVWGESMLGEIWFAEADTPTGPWHYARKVVTHDKYSFYNPKQHPMFDRANGRVIFFEGTYTHTFSGNTEQTPRYDYNQIMYRLDLADERLALPVPVYRTCQSNDEAQSLQIRTSADSVPERDRVAFFALDRKTSATIPVYSRKVNGHQQLTTESSAGEISEPVFFALPTDQSDVPATTQPLLEFVHDKTGEHRYSTTAITENGFRKNGEVCRVWPRERPSKNPRP
ncbi:MAG: hypothetical protein WKF77_02415 [Planctomycetaceae bacterium]